MRDKLAFWTTKLREEKNLRRRALSDAPHRVPYHRQREQVMLETISMIKEAMRSDDANQMGNTQR